uniref:Uncharacterized protein n=1 Tax=Echeneis naucrates TaxID=173247 RepID=A0A665W613_ECHNA
HLTATDYCEFVRLQERLLQTEKMMERITVSKSSSSTSKKEEKLLRQLRQITHLMQEGRLEGASPEIEAEEVPYGVDWEGRYEDEGDGEEDEDEEEDEEEEEEEEDAEEVIEDEDKDEEEEEEEEEAEKKQLLSPHSPHLSAERQQERVGLEVSKELQYQNGGKKQISFSDHKDVFHYPKEDTCEDEGEEEEEKEDEVEEEDDEGTEVEEEEADEDDPVMEAESLQFACEGGPNPEKEAEEDEEGYLFMSALVEGDVGVNADMPKVGVSGLRMRNRRET